MNGRELYQRAKEIVKNQESGIVMTMAEAIAKARFEDNLSRLPSPDDANSRTEATRIQALEDEYTEQYMEELDQIQRVETDAILAEDKGLEKDGEAQK